nr:hypothetical protein [Tanacetum cinerariifolium]
MYKMITFVVDLYHDVSFASNPLWYLVGEHRVIKDINFEDMYTEHQWYDVLEMINDDRHCEDKSDSDFEDVEKGDNLDDVKDIVNFQTKGEENVDIPKLSMDDPWLNKLVGKGRFVGEMEDPIPGLKDDSLDKDKGKVGEGSSHKDLGKGSAEGSFNKGKGILGLIVISDGNKGLLEAVKIWLPDAEHRQSSSMNEQFLKVMEEIKALDENAYTWLVDHDLNTWSKAYFEVDRSCAAFENGISQSFNSKILSARGKPIITMLEDIRVYIMQRVWFLNKTTMELNDSITPFARRHLEFMKIKQRKWVVYASGFQEVEVRRQDEAFGVNIHLKKCACKMWELTGLPCVRVVAGGRDQYQQAGLSVDEIPKYKEDPVIPESSSGNKRKEPLVKKESSQLNEASEPVNPAEQTHVIASASSAHVDEQPETSQDPSTKKAGSSEPVDQFPKPQDPKKKANKRKRKQIQNSHYLLGSSTKTKGDQKGLQSSRPKISNLMQMAQDLLLRKLVMFMIDCFRMNVNL